MQILLGNSFFRLNSFNLYSKNFLVLFYFILSQYQFMGKFKKKEEIPI